MADVVTTPDGRRLAYLEVGDPKGPLVLHNHGGPSSRLEARLLADAADGNGLRLVCVDRPGQGQSSPQAITLRGMAVRTTHRPLKCTALQGNSLDIAARHAPSLYRVWVRWVRRNAWPPDPSVGLSTGCGGTQALRREVQQHPLQ